MRTPPQDAIGSYADGLTARDGILHSSHGIRPQSLEVRVRSIQLPALGNRQDGLSLLTDPAEIRHEIVK